MSGSNNNSAFPTANRFHQPQFQPQQQPLQFQAPHALANRSLSHQSFHSSSTSQRSIHTSSSNNNNKPLISFPPPPPPPRQPTLSQEFTSSPPSLASQSMFGSSQNSTASSIGECLDALTKHERKLDEICLNQKQTNQMLADLLHKLNSQQVEKESLRVVAAAAARRVTVDLLAGKEEEDDNNSNHAADYKEEEEDDLWKDDYPISAQDLLATGGKKDELFLVELKRSQTFQTWRKTPPTAKRHCQS